MRAVLTNFGTTGDLQPFLALARELRRKGHEPVVAFSPNFRASVERRDLLFHPMGPNLEKEQRNVIRSLLEFEHSPDQLRPLLAPLIAALPQAVFDLREACQGADVLVGGPAQPAARMVSELIGINFVSVQLTHLYGGGSPALRQASAALINPYRRQLGLLPLANPLTLDANSPQLALYAVSRHVLPPPSDWPAHYHMPGYFFLDEDAWQPPPALLEFLDAGEPPIVFSFGSVVHQAPAELLATVLNAVRRVACRAIIQYNWSGLDQQALPPEVRAVRYIPHDWLFRRALCVVHHGGAGTAAAAYRAGVPSIFITHGPAFRAELAQELGCVGPIVPYWELTVERLASALTITISDPIYQQAATLLAEKIRAERGVEQACHLIQQLVQARPEERLTNPAAALSSDRYERILRRRSYCSQRRQRKPARQAVNGTA